MNTTTLIIGCLCIFAVFVLGLVAVIFYALNCALKTMKFDKEIISNKKLLDGD